MQVTLKSLYEKKEDFFFKGSMELYVVFLSLFVVGLSFFAVLFLDDPKRAWGAILLNNLYFFLLSFGGVILGCMQDICGAKWGRSIKRFHESFGLFFYVTSLVFIFFVLAIAFDVFDAREVYVWIKDPSMLDHFPGKNVWLQEHFFMAPVVGILVVMMAVVFWIRRQMCLADKSFLAGDLERASQLSFLAGQRLRFWCAPLLFLLGVLFTFLAIDITMSLAPLWFSTLWAGWLFAVLMQILLASILVMMFVLKDSPMSALVSRCHYHDVGKLLHGFSAFWAYLTYAHVLTYWYGNVPEETEYFIHRLHEPWTSIMIAIAVMSFVIPLFVLIPKPAKWTFGITFPLSVIILFSQWLAHIIIVQPELMKASSFEGFPYIEVSGFITFLAAFLGFVYWWGSRHLMVSLHDPLLLSHLNESH